MSAFSIHGCPPLFHWGARSDLAMGREVEIRRANRLRSKTLYSFLVISTFIFSGCASFGTLNAPQTHVLMLGEDNGFPKDYEKAFPDGYLEERGQLNTEALSLYYHERPYRSRGALPDRCLALSGGGVRSAMYTIGAMKALSEHGSLDTLDLISAVSGGAYAAGWYFQNGGADSRLLFHEDTLSRFTSPIPFQTQAVIGLMNVAHVLTGVPLSLGFSLYSTLSLNVLDPPGRPNLTSLYSAILLRPYGPAGGRQTTYRRGQYLREKGLPGFIFNLTIQDRHSDRFSSRGQIFEVSTWGMGSDLDRYVTYEEVQDNSYLRDYAEWHISDIVALSGAALSKPWQACSALNGVEDWCPLKKLWAYLRMYTGMSLGYTMWSFRDTYWDKHSFSDYFFLSDGGHSENLGAYSLIRRHCKDVTIVDAEFDEHYVFEGYLVLRHLIEDRLAGKLVLEDIDNYLEGQTLGAYPSKTWTKPVMSGKVFGVPVIENGLLNKAPIPITYLRLSIDRGKLTNLHPKDTMQVGCMTDQHTSEPETYFSARLIKLAKEDPQFPMYSTLNQFLSHEQKSSLIDLGYAHMKSELCRRESGKLH